MESIRGVPNPQFSVNGASHITNIFTKQKSQLTHLQNQADAVGLSESKNKSPEIEVKPNSQDNEFDSRLPTSFSGTKTHSTSEFVQNEPPLLNPLCLSCYKEIAGARRQLGTGTNNIHTSLFSNRRQLQTGKGRRKAPKKKSSKRQSSKKKSKAKPKSKSKSKSRSKSRAKSGSKSRRK